MISFNINVPHSHPSLAGHFTGNPVVPGVVIIDEVIRGLKDKDPSIKIINIPMIKFLTPLKPDTEVKVKVTTRPNGLLQFSLFESDLMISNGQFKVVQEANS